MLAFMVGALILGWADWYLYHDHPVVELEPADQMQNWLTYNDDEVIVDRIVYLARVRAQLLDELGREPSTSEIWARCPDIGGER